LAIVVEVVVVTVTELLAFVTFNKELAVVAFNKSLLLVVALVVFEPADIVWFIEPLTGFDVFPRFKESERDPDVLLFDAVFPPCHATK
jgi:hypothetical protein